MQKQRFFRRALTLMELMVVIVVIGLVSSVVAYNVRASLNKGRAFKTEQALNKIEDVLAYGVKLSHIDDLIRNPKQMLESIEIVKNSDRVVKDGWGCPFAFTKEGKKSVRVQSTNDPKKFRIIELSGAENHDPSQKCPLRGTLF
jgi:general secretion pathway protein G